MREGEGSVLKTFELKNPYKLTLSFLFVITQGIKKLVSRKFSELLRIMSQVWEQNKLYNFFSRQGGAKQCLRFTL